MEGDKSHDTIPLPSSYIYFASHRFDNITEFFLKMMMILSCDVDYNGAKRSEEEPNDITTQNTNLSLFLSILPPDS